MAVKSGTTTHTRVFKRTSQGGGKAKTSSMNKTQKNNYKKYRGQGR
jgi:hypothetical protein